MKSTQANYLSFAAAVLALFAIQLDAGPVYSVTNTNDSGQGSLREAILFANQAGEASILFSLTPGIHTITLFSPLPSLDANIIITGPGPNLLTLRVGHWTRSRMPWAESSRGMRQDWQRRWSNGGSSLSNSRLTDGSSPIRTSPV